ncbi:MAG: UDP-N-acetylmuramoyl-L-alanine--D-glutamate ligase [Mycoplasmatales bacterium]
MKIKIFKNKSIVFLGLGLTVYESALALEEYKAQILIVANKLDGEYYKKLQALNFKLMLEEDFLNDNLKVDIILKSPGICFDHKILQKYKNSKIINDIELTYLYIKENKLSTKVIGITGTNGKTSTTLFLEAFLQKAGYKAQSAGNIGISPLLVIKKRANLDFLILELSSFQLKNINKFKPNYSFILNITPDHLDMHDTYEDYVSSKENIYSNQTKSEFLLVNESVYNKFLSQKVITPKIVLNRVPKDIEDQIMLYQFYGINFNNLLLCYNLGTLLKIKRNYFFKTLNEFEGLEHRVEFVENINGVDFYNDSKATNLEAMRESVSKLSNIILIVGGRSKTGELKDFDKYLQNVKKVIVYGENKAEFQSEKILQRVNTLEEAMGIAREVSQENDCVLLSPASKSFDQYKNYKVRGLHFKRLTKETR